MKKTIATTLGTTAALIPASQAFAQTSVNLCPGGSQFANLCTELGAGEFGPIVGFAVNVLFTIAIVIALVFLIWGGIKWILSGGDKGKVETARSTIIAALIGLIVTFAAYFLLNIALNFFGLSLSNLTLPQLPSLR